MAAALAALRVGGSKPMMDAGAGGLESLDAAATPPTGLAWPTPATAAKAIRRLLILLLQGGTWP